MVYSCSRLVEEELEGIEGKHTELSSPMYTAVNRNGTHRRQAWCVALLVSFVCAEENHDDQHSGCSLLNKALKDRRVLRKYFNLFHLGARKVA